MRNDPPIGANYGIWPQILHQVVDTKTQVRSIKGVTFCALTDMISSISANYLTITAGGCYKKQPAFFSDPNMPDYLAPNTTPHSQVASFSCNSPIQRSNIHMNRTRTGGWGMWQITTSDPALATPNSDPSNIPPENGQRGVTSVCVGFSEAFCH